LEVVTPAAILFFAFQIASGIFLLFFAGYSLHLILLYRRHRGPDPLPAARFADDALPTVTIQLPVYNEGSVVRRLLRSAAAVDYPRDRLEIQYLDDSDDETTAIALAAIAEIRAEQPDLDIQYLKRDGREGFKAGALAHGFARARGELFAVFDADFVVSPDFLRRTVHFFSDPGVGIVQARWSHLNRDESVLTRIQAAKLDAHQMFEQTARSRAGRWVHFHGTAGVWRRSALERAGGWKCRTEVEDIEVSIRALLSGCGVVYLDQLRLPSELPRSMRRYVDQQMRWKRGWIRVTRFYTGAIWRSPVPLFQRIDFLHRLFNCFGQAVALPFTLAALPTFIVAERLGLWPVAFLLYGGLLATSLVTRVLEDRCLQEDAEAFAGGAPEGRGRRARGPWGRLRVLLPIGFILSLGTLWPMTQATFEGFGREQRWDTTPKAGRADPRPVGTGPSARRFPWHTAGTAAFGVLSAVLLAASLALGHWVAALFYVLMLAGSAWIGGALLLEGFEASGRPGRARAGAPG
jgi:cellulose synthase/poly-beta-1,6-N-acetylglucosamine synthase-like glycosyltransferase